MIDNYEGYPDCLQCPDIRILLLIILAYDKHKE